MKKAAIKKLIDGKIYIDKNFFEKRGEDSLGIYGYTEVEIPDEFFASVQSQDFDDDLTFNKEKYILRQETEIKQKYENLAESLIREKYTTGQEFAIQRKRDTEPEKFSEYFNFVEECLQKAKDLTYKTNIIKEE